MHEDVIINPHTNDIYYKDQFIPLDTPYKPASTHIGSVTSIATFDFTAFPTVPWHIVQVMYFSVEREFSAATGHM